MTVRARAAKPSTTRRATARVSAAAGRRSRPSSLPRPGKSRRENPRGGARLRDAYKGAEVNRLVEDWITSIAHPDDEMRWSLRRLRARSRESARNNPFARGYLTSLKVNVLGKSGPTLQSKIRNNDGNLNKLFNDRVELAFSQWAKKPTVDRRLSFGRFQHQTLVGVARDGEAFIRKHVGFKGNRWGFALESIDPDQLDETLNRARTEDGENEIRMGIEVDSYGGPVAYHFWSSPDRVLAAIQRKRVRVPAEEIIHLYDPDRVNQTRGIPWSATVMWPLKMLEGYSESEAVAARAGAAKMGFWTRKANEPTVGEITVDPLTQDITMDAAPGTFDFGPDGYELQTWDAKHPNTAYESYVKSKLREIATGLGMSYNALANDLEGVNYSSMRSGLLIERDVWRCMHDWWIDAFLEPVYEAWLDVALLSRNLVLDTRDYRKFLDVVWTPRGWPWVDPLKEMTAGIAGIAAGLTSRTRLLAEQGEDIEKVFEELAAEATLAEQFGIEIGGTAPDLAGDTTDDGEGDGTSNPAPTKKKGKNGNGNGRTDEDRQRLNRLAALLAVRVRGRG